jgi:hypothetical protein
LSGTADPAANHDSSTANLIRRYRENKGDGPR